MQLPARNLSARFAAALGWLLAATAFAQPAEEPAQTFAGHLGPVTMAEFTPDGQVIGTASADHLLKLWNATTGETLATLIGNTAPVSSLAISPDGRGMASGARDNTIKLWDVPQTKPIRIFNGHQAAATGLAFNADATRFISASKDKTARLWDTQRDGASAVIEGHTAELTAVACRGDQNQVATADAAGWIRLWRTFDRKADGALGAHRDHVTGLFYHSNNQQLISTGVDGLMKLWQLSAEPPRAIPGADQPVDVATISSDGKLLATAGKLDNRATIVIRQVEDGSEVGRLLGHEAPITSLAFNANHTRLISGSQDKSVRVWDLTDEKLPELYRYTDHMAAVQAVVFADTATVVSAGADKQLHHWNLADGKLVRKLEGQTGNVTALVVTSSGFASAADDGTVRLWNRANGQVTQTIEHGSPVGQLAVSPDQSKLATWGDQSQLKLWQLSDGKLIKTLRSDAADLTCLQFSPNNQRLAATVGDEVCVWQVNDGAGELQYFPEHGRATRAVSFLPDSQTLISVDAKNGLRRQPVSAIRAIDTESSGVLASASYQGGNVVVTIAGDAVIKLWTPSNGRLVREMSAPEAKLTSVTASPNGQLIAAGSESGQVFVFNSGNGSLTTQLTTPTSAVSIALSNENPAKLAVAGSDQKLRFYGLGDQQLLQEITLDSAITRLAFLPDNQQVVAVHASGAVAHWAYASPVFTRNMTGHSGGVFNLVYSNDGSQLISASADKTVRIWDLSNGRQIRALSGHQGTVFGLALSADASWIVSAGGDSTIRLWDRQSGRQLKQIDAPGALYTVAIHPDGKTVAAAGIDRQIFVYDVFTGNLKATLEGHPDYIYRVAFSHAGNRLLSCGYSGHLRVWDFPSGKLVHATRARGVLNSVAYSPDDTQIVVASDNGTAQLINLPEAAR